ncbi:hypothetical protein HY486_02850 [Candidatus Woesearchaeota archaeon]|nr:hypothetical protein [Candidatus Woesearchaeota archaeon]
MTMEDIVFPRSNEEEFLQFGARFGIDKFIFVYKNVPQKKFPATMVKESFLSYFSSRNALKKDALVYGLFETDMKLNQVVCRLANENNCTFLFPFAKILSLSGAARASFLGKWSYALRLFRKYNVRARPVSFATTPWELRSEEQLISVLDWLQE